MSGRNKRPKRGMLEMTFFYERVLASPTASSPATEMSPPEPSPPIIAPTTKAGAAAATAPYVDIPVTIKSTKCVVRKILYSRLRKDGMWYKVDQSVQRQI